MNSAWDGYIPGIPNHYLLDRWAAVFPSYHFYHLPTITQDHACITPIPSPTQFLIVSNIFCFIFVCAFSVWWMADNPLPRAVLQALVLYRSLLETLRQVGVFGRGRIPQPVINQGKQ